MYPTDKQSEPQTHKKKLEEKGDASLRPIGEEAAALSDEALLKDDSLLPQAAEELQKHSDSSPEDERLLQDHSTPPLSQAEIEEEEETGVFPAVASLEDEALLRDSSMMLAPGSDLSPQASELEEEEEDTDVFTPATSPEDEALLRDTSPILQSGMGQADVFSSAQTTPVSEDAEGLSPQEADNSTLILVKPKTLSPEDEALLQDTSDLLQQGRQKASSLSSQPAPKEEEKKISSFPQETLPRAQDLVEQKHQKAQEDFLQILQEGIQSIEKQIPTNINQYKEVQERLDKIVAHEDALQKRLSSLEESQRNQVDALQEEQKKHSELQKFCEALQKKYDELAQNFLIYSKDVSTLWQKKYDELEEKTHSVEGGMVSQAEYHKYLADRESREANILALLTNLPLQMMEKFKIEAQNLWKEEEKGWLSKWHEMSAQKEMLAESQKRVQHLEETLKREFSKLSEYLAELKRKEAMQLKKIHVLEEVGIRDSQTTSERLDKTVSRNAFVWTIVLLSIVYFFALYFFTK